MKDYVKPEVEQHIFLTEEITDDIVNDIPDTSVGTGDNDFGEDDFA